MLQEQENSAKKEKKKDKKLPRTPKEWLIENKTVVKKDKSDNATK